ncbi:MAG: substrate-binding domain-containing protein [Erysipelotrichales bacterium]|nr:substrate-binding domain-containing protein [Erysipelotrichales bacterium]
MKKLFKALAVSLAILMVLGGCSSNQGGENNNTPVVEDKGVLLMATTTSTADTGLLDYLAPIFKQDTGYTLEWSAVGTGEAINMGKNGDVSVILVHAKASEEEFVNEGYGVERFEVMYNDYIVIGPKESVAYSNDIEATFKAVVDNELKWVNRGDNSGTDKKERQIWKALGIDPATNPNYVESGQGMGATINMADEQMALCLTDRGTYLKVKNDATLGIELEIICEKDDNLLNQYGVIAVSPDKYPDTDIEGANAFIEWICSEKIQALIGEFGVDKYGQPLFFPNAKK